MIEQPKKKDPAAVRLGRRGGRAKTTKLKGLAAVSKQKRKEISAAGVEARNAKKEMAEDKTLKLD